jgi:CO/xanthine dehydrogenase Mo-binding subunit
MAEPFHRSDARTKVTGHATYGVDLVAPRMLVGGLMRARVPAGRIERLDVSRAAAMPGVWVVTAADLPVPRYGMVLADQPPLADTHVRFSGEPVAAVAAVDEATLVAALDAVELRVTPTERVDDPETALTDGAPRVHEDLDGYEAHVPTERYGNVCGRSRVEDGGVDEAFARAAHVVSGTYRTPRVHQGYIEPRACLATARPDGGYEVRTSTQNPFGVRGTLAKILDLPPSRIHVRGTVVGGGFGGKLDVTFEHYACLLARASGRPVKFVSSRAEEFVAANPRENSVVEIRSALDEDGTIIGREVRCLLDAGAYAHDTPFIGSVASLQGSGPYRVGSVRCEALSVYTNTQPTGAYRGPTGPQMVLAVESHMDELADTVGEDRVAYRRRHLFHEGDRAGNGQIVTGVSIEECLDRATEAIGYGRDLPEHHGIGIACAWWTTTGQPTSAAVRLDGDGTLAVTTGATEIGSGALAAGVVHLVADAFGVAPDAVRLASTSDTEVSSFDFGAQGSRTTFSVGRAALAACDELRDQLLEEAAELLEADPGDLEVAEGQVRVLGAPERARGIAEVGAAAQARRGPLHATASFAAPPTEHDRSCTGPDHFYPAFSSPSFHCHAVEVAVDPETGAVNVVRYVAVQDVGRALVPPAIEGQVHGGVLQGIGYALYEEQRLVDGHVADTDLERYKLPTAVEAPPLEVVLVEEPSPVGPHGAKGVGEPPIIVPGAAVASAVAAATGRRVHELPLTPERVLELLP